MNDLVSQEEVLTAVKALKHRLEKDILVAVKTLKDHTADQIPSLLSSEVQKAFQESEEGWEKRLLDMEGRFAKHLQDVEEKHLRDLRELSSRHERQVKELEERSSREVKALLEFHSQSTTHLESLIKGLSQLPPPQVQVTVPENAIQVKQLPSEVHIESPQVFVPPDSVRVHLDQPPAPQVVISDKAFHLQIDQPPAHVSVNVPHPRLVTKHIEYDQYGRPMHIEEREAGA